MTCFNCRGFKQYWTEGSAKTCAKGGCDVIQQSNPFDGTTLIRCPSCKPKLYYIFDWYGDKIEDNFPTAKITKFKRFDTEGTKKNPILKETEFEAWSIEIEDIHEFVEKWGKTIQLSPPSERFPYWCIYTSRTGRWNQR